jgi:hypothetical protein
VNLFPLPRVDKFVGAAILIHPVSHWPEGALFRNPFGTGPPQGPLSLRDNGGFGFVFLSEKIFFIRSLMPRARFPHLTTQ